MVPLMPVWRNFFLGSEPRKGVGPLGRLDVGLMRRTTREELNPCHEAMPFLLCSVERPPPVTSHRAQTPRRRTQGSRS